jgi:hypothetical protein
VTAGKNWGEARRLAEEALAFHIRGMVEDGEILVPASSEKTVRVNITARKSQLSKIDQLAEKAGMNRSAYLIQMADGRRCCQGLERPSLRRRRHGKSARTR